jgi:geranylgeranyl reductase family protein
VHAADHKNAAEEIVIVGAGPAGSSAATFLAMHGISALVLDKEEFPRDKVCGDGLTPQAIYWLDQLGCAEAVLGQTRSCIRECDLYMDGEYLLSGRFPEHTKYPNFSVLLDRKRFDAILLDNALAHGARFRPQSKVSAVHVEKDGVLVNVTSDHSHHYTVKAKVVIGSDGVSSIVSRSLGNQLKAGVTAVSIRTYFRNVRHDRSQIKVYFDETFFPGYGWIFIDNTGFANAGIGYAYDPLFPIPIDLKDTFARFVGTDLQHMLRGATQCAPISGGAASFYKPRFIVGERMLLIGDAANQADPLNGGGIHKAMENAHIAAQAVANAFRVNDFSKPTLSVYETLWNERYELDRRAGDLLLTVAKNPALKNFCMFLLKNIGRLTRTDHRFRDFCAGVFSGMIPQHAAVSPLAVLEAFPNDVHSWLFLLQEFDREFPLFPFGLASKTLTGSLDLALQIAQHPSENIDWALDVMTKSIRLFDHTSTSGFT